jgi:hypothetical protein
MCSVRYCRRCRTQTDHVEDDPPRLLRWRWVLFWPLPWLAVRVLDRPLCLECLRREAELLDDDLVDDD